MKGGTVGVPATAPGAGKRGRGPRQAAAVDCATSRLAGRGSRGAVACRGPERSRLRAPIPSVESIRPAPPAPPGAPPLQQQLLPGRRAHTSLRG
eukprot:4548463-Alexandrium_andersonii.AAC.1